MIRNRFLSTAVAVTGLLLVAPAAMAGPVVQINQGQASACTVTPSTGTVFTLSTTTGDVLINGSYGSNCNIGGSSGGTGSGPTFTPLNPAPANLSVLPSALGSNGGPVTPTFVVYNTKTCIGQVTATAGCAAVPAPWGTGGTVCSAGAGQSYCSPSGTVAIPGNTTGSACSYTFQAINCTDNTTSINSQTATVSVSASGGGGGCVDGASSDLIGYTRQCSGSATNYKGSASWDNTAATLFAGPWPFVGQTGKSWTVTVNANQYASFKIVTGTTQGGVQLPFNNTTGYTGLMSISTVPGDFVSGSIICTNGSSLSVSSKTGTSAQCKLSANSTYYMNISMASTFSNDQIPPVYPTTCPVSACATSWTMQSYD